MSINDSISDYNLNENVYNQYISELEELSKSKDDIQEKCARIFESCRVQLKEVAPFVTSGVTSGTPSEQVGKVLSVMKEQLHLGQDSKETGVVCGAPLHSRRKC